MLSIMDLDFILHLIILLVGVIIGMLVMLFMFVDKIMKKRDANEKG